VNPNGWPTASELLQALAGDPSDNPSVPLDQLRWLGRYGLVEELEDWVGRLRNSPHWGAPLALEASLAWLLAGDGHRADLAVLEADDLDPSLGLVPDPWRLWPAPGEPRVPTPEAQRAGAAALAARIRRWRCLKPTVLADTWRQGALADWTMALSSPGLEELILLLRHGPALDPPIEPFLAELVGEGPIAASPAQALQFWALLTDLRPDWSHARLKAADLALGQGDRQRCDSWIATASPDTQRSPWFWDIAARSALEAGAISTAIDHWGQALAEAPPELAEVFRQRRREARRGPGLLQARALLDRGDTEVALALLKRMVADDPQWQPLRALMLQAETTVAPAGVPMAVADQAPQRFGQLLEQAAARIGLTLPPADLGSPVPDPEAARLWLEAFSRTLSDAEARFALGA
jgi:tetratricopeptide (TPR) repeat protein